MPKAKPKPKAEGAEEAEAVEEDEQVTGEKVPCKSCGRDIKPNWTKCPFCGKEQ